MYAIKTHIKSSNLIQTSLFSRSTAGKYKSFLYFHVHCDDMLNMLYKGDFLSNFGQHINIEDMTVTLLLKSKQVQLEKC